MLGGNRSTDNVSVLKTCEDLEKRLQETPGHDLVRELLRHERLKIQVKYEQAMKE